MDSQTFHLGWHELENWSKCCNSLDIMMVLYLFEYDPFLLVNSYVVQLSRFDLVVSKGMCMGIKYLN